MSIFLLRCVNVVYTFCSVDSMYFAEVDVFLKSNPISCICRSLNHFALNIKRYSPACGDLAERFMSLSQQLLFVIY